MGETRCVHQKIAVLTKQNTCPMAGHVARSSASTWLWRVTAWRDAVWTRLSLTSSSMRPLRPSRRRWVKWEHTLQRFTQQEGLGWWTTFACGGIAQQWLQHQDAFGAF